MITIALQPDKYSPLNAALFRVTSDRSGILQFKVTVYDADTDDVMFIKKYATLPMVTNGTVFNIAPELSSFIDFQLKTSSDLLVETPKIMKRYHVGIIELYRNEDGDIVEGDTNFIEDDFFVWNGTISRPAFLNYNQDQYVATSSNPATVFFNNRPLTSSVRYSEIQYLYFISTVVAKAVITLYKRPGHVVGLHEITGIAVNKAYRLSVSPEALVNFYGNNLFTDNGGEFTDEFNVQFGDPVSIRSADYYTVKLIDSSGAVISEVRTFNIKKVDCIQTVNVLFSNDLGGYDSLMFNSPKQAITIARTTIEANPLQFDSTGQLTTETDGVYNPDEVTISSTKSSSFSLVSDLLNDDLAYFAKTIIEASKVLVQLPDGFMYPVQVSINDYNINKARYNTASNRLTLTFKVVDTNIKL